MTDAEVFLCFFLGTAGIFFFIAFIVYLIGGGGDSYNRPYNRSYRSRNRYGSSGSDWEDHDFDGFHDHDDTAWNEDEY